MQGILLVDKPIGWTSFDVVAYVRKILAEGQKVRSKDIKVGHAGTLDPLASGLLVLLIGKDYTRQAASFSKLNKDYLFKIRLGQVTASGDKETKPLFYAHYRPTRAEIKAATLSLSGPVRQTPPIYSALKVDGQRAYELARQGKSALLKPRLVTIYRLELLDYAYPVVEMRARVSSGTYIRSLAYDFGLMLKCGAYLLELQRTAIGDFKLARALNVKTLSYKAIAKNLILN